MATQQPAEEEQVSLSEVFDEIMLTPAEASSLLQSWANQFRDSYPNLTSRLQEGATSLTEPKPAPKEEQGTRPGAFQAPDVVREEPNVQSQPTTASEQATQEPPVPPPA